jgi:hypothetical protein
MATKCCDWRFVFSTYYKANTAKSFPVVCKYFFSYKKLTTAPTTLTLIQLTKEIEKLPIVVSWSSRQSQGFHKRVSIFFLSQ